MVHVEIPEQKQRDLLLSEDVSNTSVKDIITKIFEINYDDDKQSKIYKRWDRDPIKLYVNSYGGSVYDGLALVDVIKTSKTPIHTICIGSCMSMGLWIWLAGKKRIIGRNSTLMFHDISLWAVDKSEFAKQELEESLRLQEALIKEITSTSRVKEKMLRDYISRKAEWYIPSKESIDLGLADQYLR